MLARTRLIGVALPVFVALPAAAQVTAVRAGRLVGPEAGTIHWRIR